MPGPENNKVGFSRLVEWVEGNLTEEEARRVGRQVANADEATRADVEWLRGFARVAGDAVLESPPAEVREVLVARFEAYAEGRRAPGFLERLVATLTFDGGLRPAAGVRAAGAQGSRRRLAYSTSVADVALSVRLRHQDGNVDVDGQVFPNGGGGDPVMGRFGVQLLRDGAEFGIATTDEVGAFAFEAVAPGVYEMPMGAEGVEILVAPVELRV